MINAYTDILNELNSMVQKKLDYYNEIRKSFSPEYLKREKELLKQIDELKNIWT